MKPISHTQALNRLKTLKDDLRAEISNSYEQNAKSCLTCETQGACCLDAHFVNVHISRLEAVAIEQTLDKFPEEKKALVFARIDETIKRYSLTAEGDTFAQTYACPLFEQGIGCLVHNEGKPLACITHACYENERDLPPGHLLADQEARVEDLNRRTYSRPHPWLPIPLALKKHSQKEIHKVTKDTL
ncbi:MAG: hypothetical protein ACKVQJ_11740 [Pyrinomonadaceae bacterium]